MREAVGVVIKRADGTFLGSISVSPTGWAQNPQGVLNSVRASIERGFPDDSTD